MNKKKQSNNPDRSLGHSFIFAEEIVCDTYFASEESDEDEIEYAYQCDFQKRQPQKLCKPSLLSNMLTNEQHNRNELLSGSLPKSVTITDNNENDFSGDPLSESLKRNLEWQKTQDIMKKYDEILIKKLQTEEMSYTDEFSRW
ncbi:hypothetical protein A0J61_01595 [Choanephora cucurbitarum]|uniref:Uncharacterized protein n=1 Tax=Choanephora cucurbitarum TaxID=101091 RepID=A0A1C7NMX8_9FUNG|nr:hypothetical protein A0J61_01595 [Choanephora cucurbitarum]